MASILIVEDEATILMLAESIIQDAGHQTLSASSLREAEAIIESGASFDLVFTDIQLQGEAEGGIKVGDMISQLRPELPVLYTSACGINESLRLRLRGHREFMPKPYRFNDALSRIDRLLHA
jgi:DNA-binding NtrC family response regulator